MNDFEQLYRKHASAIFRFAWGLCGDQDTAEDIVSETFVRLITKAPRIKTRTALGYLLIIARNVYLMGLRRSSREIPLPQGLRAPAQDPGSSIDERANLDSVITALARMPEGERTALLLRVDHDLSYADIAVALDISVSAAKVRVHRARRRLTSVLTEQRRRP